MHLKHLGPYELGRPIGKGGMGSVYEAVDTSTGQRVAIKALSPHLAMADGFRERFEAEIESLKTLRHEGIVRLYGYGEQDGVLFYSMELVEGISLEDELKAGRRFTWREVSTIAIQLSLALKHAHDHGIVHRDIKPANVLLFNEDRVKLADFGIARLFGTTALTTAGGVLGTADYMSPEQADGRPVTARCDQYSLGGVMYTLLAGRPPFQAKSLPQMLQLQRFAKPEPVRRYAPDAPEQMERVVMQLLAKNPAERFPNTQVLARHLQAMVKALSRPAADDFALASEPHVVDPLDGVQDHLVNSELTQIEVSSDQPSVAPPSRADDRVINAASHDAATLAADDEVTSPPAPLTQAAAAQRIAVATAPRAAVAASRFTTVEEEEARRRAENQRSWLMIAGQLAALVMVLGGMGMLALYLSQPPSADALYQTITKKGIEDEASVANVEREIEEFLRRFPTDARAAELTKYREQLTLDKAERRLQRDARAGRNPNLQLLPAERLYVQAVQLADSDPDHAISMLQSLADLYGPTAPITESSDQSEIDPDGREVSGPDARVITIVQLAQRKLDALRHDLAKQRKVELAALQERLNAAERLMTTDASRAADMYHAVIELYRNDTWAARIVEEAQKRLAEIEPPTHEP
jgi:serine/threonine-protein kinase